jgi:hypothetical protein
MTSTEYAEIIENACARLSGLSAQKEGIEQEMAKLRHFILATINLLPTEQRHEFYERVTSLIMDEGLRAAGLTDAIREILKANPKKWFSAKLMRDHLLNTNFDFSSYVSNPLASVSTTLKRLAPDEAELMEIDGVAAFRWRNTKANRERAAKRQQARVAALYGVVPESMREK